MDPIFSQQFNMPAPKGGMFAGDTGKFGIGQAIVAALNGYLASQPGGAGEVGRNNMQMMAAMRQRALEHQQSLEDYNRKRADDNTDYLTHLQQQSQYREPGEFEQALIASGVNPGTPEWTQAMKTKVQNTLDPAVITPQGMMLRSQITGALQPPAAPVGKLTPFAPGGPAPQAPGGFPY